MHPRDQFERTVCDCIQCRIPCRHMPGTLAIGDVERIADHLHVPPADRQKWALDHFQASDSVRVIFAGHEMRIRTIVPRLTDTGCIFLRNGRCSIHDVAPYGCSHYDWHMGAREADLRTSANLVQIVVDASEAGPYSELHSKLDAAPPLEVRRKNIELDPDFRS